MNSLEIPGSFYVPGAEINLMANRRRLRISTNLPKPKLHDKRIDLWGFDLRTLLTNNISCLNRFAIELQVDGCDECFDNEAT